MKFQADKFIQAVHGIQAKNHTANISSAAIDTLGYDEALKAVPFSPAVVTSLDETAQRCMLALPGYHALESWGDHTVRSGVVYLQQPVIAPLYDSRQAEAVLLAWMNPSKPYSEDLYHAYLMRRWETEVHATSGTRSDFKTFWYASLHDGCLNGGVIPLRYASIFVNGQNISPPLSWSGVPSGTLSMSSSVAGLMTGVDARFALCQLPAIH